MTKLKNSNCDQNQMVTKVKNQIVTILKNSNCDKTQKHKCDKSPILNTHIVKKTQNLKLWQNSKNQNVTKLKNSNCDKTQKVIIVTYFSKNNLTPRQPMRCSWGSFLQFLWCFLLYQITKIISWMQMIIKKLQQYLKSSLRLCRVC